MKGKVSWKLLILSFVVVIIMAGLGSLLTSGNTNTTWYQQIKPSITPPNWVFPIAWNILFILIAVALYFSLIKLKSRTKKFVIGIYATNFILNVLWSLLFFKLHLVGWAFLEIIIMWISILILIEGNWKGSRISSYLLMPYALWVAFASILNYLMWTAI